MKAKFKKMMISTILVIALGSNAAWAVNPTGEVVLTRTGVAGSFFTNMGSPNEFCYLSEVKSQEAGQSTDCRVLRGATNWTLIANLGASGTTSVTCRAYCYSR